jgi:hypothetical protein
MSLLEKFCAVDDYCQEYEAKEARERIGKARRHPGPQGRLVASEIITIVLHFHESGYRTFKGYYQQHVQAHLRSEFPDLVSYTRFVELMPRVILPLFGFLLRQLGSCTGIAFADSTPLAVCHPKRRARHKVFAGLAQRAKNSMGWFLGFKLHLIVNECGELLAFRLTPGNVDDRQPLPALALGLWGKLFADKGYLSQPLTEQLLHQGLRLVTPLRKNMSNRLLPLLDKLWLRKRVLIETIYDQLKNIQQIEHSRHRSASNFLLNLLAGLLAYCFQPKKPAISLSPSQRHDLLSSPLLLS